MSQLSPSDVKALALCLYDDPTRHDADHDKIRSLISNLPCHLRDCKLATIFAEPHYTVKSCLVHEGIASLVVSYLFTSLQKEVVDSVPILKKYGPYLGPEEIYTLEKVITIEGMWSPPTARTEPPKLRYWDYQVNKCQACMISRIAYDPSALRDMRTLILASIDSGAQSTDPRLIPNNPTTLSFVNEWISLSSRSDELFYYSGIQAASIKAAKRKFEEMMTAPLRCSGNTNFSYPHPLRTDYASSYSSNQSTTVFSPTHTPGSSTSSKNSNNFEWPLFRRFQTSGSSSESTFPTKYARFRKPNFSSSSQSSEPLLFLPFKQQQTCPVDSVAYTNSLYSSVQSASPPVLGAGSFIERDTRTPRPCDYDSPEDGQYNQKSLSGTTAASGRDSFSSFILRDPPFATQPPPSPRRVSPSRFVNPVPQGEDSGIGHGYRQRPTQDESEFSWTFVNSDTSTTDVDSLRQGLEEPAASTVNFHSQTQGDAEDDEDEVPLISRWSTTSTGHTWTSLLKKTTTTLGPRLGKVKKGKAVVKQDVERDAKKKSRMAIG